MWGFIRAAAGGAWSLVRSIPLSAYVWLLVLALIAWAQVSALSRARAAGDAAARADLAPKLVLALDQLGAEQQAAADAEGRAHELDAGLQRCIGARVQMDLLTSAILQQREKQRVAAVAALNTTRKELSNAYSAAADDCAYRPVPAVVIGVLDAAAFGHGQVHTYAVDYGPGAAAGAGAVVAYGADAGAAAAGAYTANADLARWIAEGWIPALAACNADKAAIAALRPQP